MKQCLSKLPAASSDCGINNALDELFTKKPEIKQALKMRLKGEDVTPLA